ncbi:flagellar basal body L-ring protein FlgH [Fundidesulfovibrio butyratiphilus]
MNSNIKTLVALAVSAALCGGCVQPATKNPTPMPSLTPPVAQAPPPSHNPASLYSQASQPNYLYEDNRARRVGDIVMVNIVEKSDAKSTVKTKSNKDNETNMGVSAYMSNHQIDPVPGSTLLTNAGVNAGQLINMQGRIGSSPIVKTSSNNQFTSDAETSRKNYITSTIGCRVVNILPGGVMQVEGARQVRVNDDTQIMVVRGLVRPSDIQPDNSINSVAMAECQVEMYGTGVLADRQKPGWLSRVLDNVWPF